MTHIANPYYFDTINVYSSIMTATSPQVAEVIEFMVYFTVWPRCFAASMALVANKARVKVLW